MARVLLAMSGGVDSSVAAHLLQLQGHEVLGLFMHRAGKPAEGAPIAPASRTDSAQLEARGSDELLRGCSVDAVRDAQRIADRLNIALDVAGFDSEFQQVIDYFVAEYGRARTPNPCIVCNRWLKFGRLFDYAERLGAQYVATGHHARRLWGDDGLPRLYRGVDPEKDQSYALFGIEPARLGRILLPVGEFRKTEIRQVASELGFGLSEKGESQEICFVTPGRHAEFVQAQRGFPDTSGRIITTDGTVVGHHSGIERFTIGQRKGLGVAMGVPYFVVRIDAASRDVVIGPRQALERRELTAGTANWLATPPAEPLHCQAQIRYNAHAVPATIWPLAENRLRVRFDAPVTGVAPGQAVVCYDEDRVLGGGWIES